MPRAIIRTASTEAGLHPTHSDGATHGGSRTFMVERTKKAQAKAARQKRVQRWQRAAQKSVHAIHKRQKQRLVECVVAKHAQFLGAFERVEKVKKARERAAAAQQHETAFQVLCQAREREAARATELLAALRTTRLVDDARQQYGHVLEEVNEQKERIARDAQRWTRLRQYEEVALLNAVRTIAQEEHAAQEADLARVTNLEADIAAASTARRRADHRPERDRRAVEAWTERKQQATRQRYHAPTQEDKWQDTWRQRRTRIHREERARRTKARTQRDMPFMETLSVHDRLYAHSVNLPAVVHRRRARLELDAAVDASLHHPAHHPPPSTSRIIQ